MSETIETKTTDHTVHVGLSPDDVMVMVNNHRSAENMQVLHHVFLNISQCGHVCVITCRINTHTHTDILMLSYFTHTEKDF